MPTPPLSTHPRLAGAGWGLALWLAAGTPVSAPLAFLFGLWLGWVAAARV